MNRRFFICTGVGAVGIAGRNALSAEAQEAKFQLGCVTYNLLQGMDLESVVRILEKTGIAAVELRAGHKHNVEPSIGTDERARVRERFSKSKVRLLSYGTTCEFQSPDVSVRRKQVDLAKSFVDLAHDTGALGVKVRPNGLPDGVEYGTTIRNIAGGLHEVAEYGLSKGIEIWMEIHGRGTMEPKTAAEILHTADHKNVGACWNSNPTDVKDGSVRRSFELLQPFLRSAHINDLYNDYPWREFFHLLRDSEYQRYTLAEVAESKEPERFLQYYKALWRQLTA